MKLINNGYEFSGYRTSYIIAELPNFNTDEYDITTGEREHACDIYYKKSIELSIDTSLFQLSDDECGYLSFSIKVFDSQNKEIDVSSRGSTDIGIYFIINENDIKFDYDYRNLE